MDVWTDIQNFSLFYRTSSSVGAAAQILTEKWNFSPCYWTQPPIKAAVQKALLGNDDRSNADNDNYGDNDNMVES